MTIITRIGTHRPRLALLGLLPVAVVVLVLTGGAQAGRRTARVTQPVSLSSPVWSPDGRHVAWVATTEDNVTEAFTSTVWVADASGRRARRLHSFPSDLIEPAWVTPTSLLAGTESRLYRLALSGRVRLLMNNAGFGFSLDPSRRFVAEGSDDCPFSDCAGSIEILNLRTGRVRRIGSPAELNTEPSLSPGAGSVAYARTTCNSQTGNCVRRRGIWVARVDSRGKPHRILRSSYSCPVWSPDGRLIAYTRPAGYPGGTYRPGSIGILHVGGRGHLIATPALCLYPPVFSPDSRFLAFQANRALPTPGARLAVIDLSTRRVILRTPWRLGQVDGPSWSPDGSKILFVARYHDPDALGCIYVGNVATRRWRLFRACAEAKFG